MKKLILMLSIISSLVSGSAHAGNVIWPVNESYKCDETEFGKILAGDQTATDRFINQHNANVDRFNKNRAILDGFLIKYGKTWDQLGELLMSHEDEHQEDLSAIIRASAYMSTASDRLRTFQACRDFVTKK